MIDFSLSRASRIATFHTIDYLAPSKSNRLRERFGWESMAFLAIDRVTHAFRHEHAGRESSPTPLLLTKEARSRGSAVFGETMFGENTFGDLSGTILPNESWGILNLVNEAADFLRKRIERHTHRGEWRAKRISSIVTPAATHKASGPQSRSGPRATDLPRGPLPSKTTSWRHETPS
jgi:hypothetical protein